MYIAHAKQEQTQEKHMTKRKTRSAIVPANAKQQLAQARRAHTKGSMCMEDFIWRAVQCYAADNRKI